MSLPRFDGRFNMLEDARLLAEAEAGKTGWRVYGWDGPWVSLGHYQSPERDLLDPELVPWVMRPTGGKAVLHGHDVTVGLAAPLGELAEWGEPSDGSDQSDRFVGCDLSRSLKTVYRLAIRPILEAMRACGVPAVLGEDFKNEKRNTKNEGETTSDERRTMIPETAGPQNRNTAIPPPPNTSILQYPVTDRTADCFAVVSPNDIVDIRTGLKVCGCALKLTQTAVLVQASLPAGTPLVDPRAVFARPAILASAPWNHEAFPEAFAAAMAARAAVSAVR